MANDQVSEIIEQLTTCCPCPQSGYIMIADDNITAEISDNFKPGDVCVFFCYNRSELSETDKNAISDWFADARLEFKQQMAKLSYTTIEDHEEAYIPDLNCALIFRK